MWEDCDDVLEWNVVVSDEFICMMESLYVGLFCEFGVRSFAISFTETWAIYLSYVNISTFWTFSFPFHTVISVSIYILIPLTHTQHHFDTNFEAQTHVDR